MSLSSNPSNTPKAPTLLERGKNLNGRLQEVLVDIQRVRDTLFGSIPREIEKNAEAHAASHEHHLTSAHELVSTIRSELDSILTGL